MGTNNDPPREAFWSTRSESPCLLCSYQMDWTSQQETNNTWKQERQRIFTLYSVLHQGGGNTCRERRRLLTFGSKEWEKLIEDFPFEKLWKEWWKKKIDAEPNKGEPGNQNIRKFRYKNRNADGRGRILLKAILWNLMNCILSTKRGVTPDLRFQWHKNWILFATNFKMDPGGFALSGFSLKLHKYKAILCNQIVFSLVPFFL